jgi:Pyruvate/2-oxoacid:ferredoxin oxidoreductase gamma subunit
MTGGQCSATTPPEASVGSGFLNRLEKPIDICQVAGAAGAAHLARLSAYDSDLAAKITDALCFRGFALMDIWGVCPGRYTRKNRLTPSIIQQNLEELPPVDHLQTLNLRPEYGDHYREEASRLAPAASPLRIDPRHQPPTEERREVVLLGSAGQRVGTAAELLCLAGATAGLQATQKNDYPITVLRGHSVSEVVLSRNAIGFTGIHQPHVVMALAAEGVARRPKIFTTLDVNALVIGAKGVAIPETHATVIEIDCKQRQIKTQDMALAALAVLAQRQMVLRLDMLRSALGLRFDERIRELAMTVVERATS